MNSGNLAENGLEYKIVELLKEKNMTISTAESCTGGLIAASIVNVPGCSAVFNQGFITYANEAKVKYLGVDVQTIEKYGVVSEEVVMQMAKGCAVESNSDVSVVTSGIAGPDGGTKEKPVGLVWMAAYVSGNLFTHKEIFSGNREEVRNQAKDAALKLLIENI